MSDLDELLRVDAAHWRASVDALRLSPNDAAAVASAVPQRRPRRVVQAMTAAALLIVVLAVGVTLIGTRHHMQHSASRHGDSTVISTNPADLVGVTWRLRTIHHDPDGITEDAHAPIPLSFAATGTRVVTASSGPIACSASQATITSGRITFTRWIALAVAGPDCTVLDTAQHNFVFSLLTGTVSWSISEDRLTITKAGTGRLSFDRS